MEICKFAGFKKLLLYYRKMHFRNREMDLAADYYLSFSSLTISLFYFLINRTFIFSLSFVSLLTVGDTLVFDDPRFLVLFNKGDWEEHTYSTNQIPLSEQIIPASQIDQFYKYIYISLQ